MSNKTCEQNRRNGLSYNDAHNWIRDTSNTDRVLVCSRVGCPEIGYRMPGDEQPPVSPEWLGKVEGAATTKGSRTREGDQELPSTLVPGQLDDQALLIQDIESRRELGIQRYGQGHQPWNGRDTLRDYYDERLDGLVYLRSILRMADASHEDLVRIIHATLLDPDVRQKADASTETMPLYYAGAIADRIGGYVAGIHMKENL